MSYKIIFATKNENKVKEVNQIMKDLDVEVISMKQANIDVDIVEDGTTFEENALKKATEIMKLSNCLVLADDSGLEVDYLNKAPGIYSARFGGENATDQDKNNMIIDKLKNVDDENRTARFVCAIAAALPNGKTYVERGVIEGIIGYEEKGDNGFGYDPIFYVPEYGMTTAQMPSDQKNKISHRGRALEKMKDILREILK